MKKGIKTILYIGLAAIAGYLGYTYIKNKEEEQETESSGGSSQNVGQTGVVENEDGLAVEPPTGVTTIVDGGTAQPQLNEPIVIGTEESGLQLLVENVANGVYEFTPIYNQNGSVGLADNLLEDVRYTIDGEIIGDFFADSSVIQEFTSSGTYSIQAAFRFVPNSQFPNGAEFNLYGAINVVLDGGVANPNNIYDYIEEIDATQLSNTNKVE